MEDKILIKSGSGDSRLVSKELAYHTTEKALYIGTEKGNIKLCNADDILKLEGKLTATQMEMQENLGDGAELGDVITAFNSLLASLKANGIMKTNEE